MKGFVVGVLLGALLFAGGTLLLLSFQERLPRRLRIRP